MTVRRPLVRWSPPPEHCYKASFNATLFENSDCAGIGVVYRDHAGNFIAALSQKIAMVQSVKLAEVFAARRAVVFAKELSLFQVMIEGDCLLVIQALNNSGQCNTLYDHVVEETQSLGSTLQHYQFQHVRREGSRLVHALARGAVVSGHRCMGKRFA